MTTRLEEWESFSVAISRQVIRTGCGDTGISFVAAELELTGTLIDGRYMRPKPKTSVTVEIQFTDVQQYVEEYVPGDDNVPEGYDEGANYIGTIELRSPSAPSGEEPELEVMLRLFLTLSVLPLLTAMDGKQIKLATAHDSITNPTMERPGFEYVVAFVKRATFEPV